MKIIKLAGALAIFGLLTFTTEAQLPTAQVREIDDMLNVALVGQVQQEAVQSVPGHGVLLQQTQRTTKLKIDTKSLLALIAADQGFVLPPKAKLRLVGDTFYVVRQEYFNLPFTNVDRELLTITFVTNVLESALVQRANGYTDTERGTSVATLVYNGSSVSFTLNCYGKEIYHDAGNYTNGVSSYSYSSWCFGSGSYGGRNMIITGSLKGNNRFQYVNVEAVPIQLPQSPPAPGSPILVPPVGPILLPPPPADPGTSGGAVIVAVGYPEAFHPGGPGPIPPGGAILIPPAPMDPGPLPAEQ